MCGIVGIASRKPISELESLVSARDVLSHRGPDDSGTWWSDNYKVGLGHRRLSIIDLSSAGHQPMLHSANETVLVFNGEIYNFNKIREELRDKGHSFQSKSDTEVILVAYLEWGYECIEKFNGMFTFAIYDLSKKQLFIARDRAGEKPLFFCCKNGTLSFASELKSLMKITPCLGSINIEALDCYLAMGYIPKERCILEDCNKLPPGHALSFNVENGDLNIWQYWKLPTLPEVQEDVTYIDEDALLSELQSLLEDSVKNQLVADVPIGVLLSGGVDSSLITAVASEKISKIKTFTIRFPNYGEYDETEHARLISRHFGTEHIELDAEPSSVEMLPMLARQFDEPMVDSSMIPTYLVSEMVRDYCPVVLGGDGADELFGGYPHYHRMIWLQNKLGWLPSSIKLMFSLFATHLLPIGFRGRNWLQAINFDREAGLPMIGFHFDLKARKKLLSQNVIQKYPNMFQAESVYNQLIPRVDNLLDRATRMDFENYLAEDILVKVDRASMLNSLEVRAPWLDYRLIEFAFGKVPAHLKATESSRKVLPKKLAQKMLPSEFNTHRKQGFSIPLSTWLRENKWRNYFKEVLLDSNESLFNRSYIESLLCGQMKGRMNSERLFALVILELWRKNYRAKVN